MGSLNRKIEYYFSIESRISHVYKRIKILNTLFASRSKYTCTTYDEHLGRWYAQGYDVEREVTWHVDNLHRREKEIERYLMKQKYFNRYLTSLPYSNFMYLYDRYHRHLDIPVKEEIEERTIAEIKEIDRCVFYHYYGVPEDELKFDFVSTGDLTNDLNDTLEALGL